MTTVYLNTGVKIWDNPHIKGGIDSGNGTVVIPISVDDLPKQHQFLLACDIPNLFSNNENIICREIKNSSLLSKFAYFNISGVKMEIPVKIEQ